MELEELCKQIINGTIYSGYVQYNRLVNIKCVNGLPQVPKLKNYSFIVMIFMILQLFTLFLYVLFFYKKKRNIRKNDDIHRPLLGKVSNFHSSTRGPP